MDSLIGPVGKRIQAEMIKLGYEEVRFDKMGNTFGRIGSGPRVLLYDSHIDTVGVGDIGSRSGILLSVRSKTATSTPAAPATKRQHPRHGLRPGGARDLGLLDRYTVYYFGNMEEWCDGIAPNAFVEVDPHVKPDFVVIGEPAK